MEPLVEPETFDALVREHQAGLRAYIRALGAQDAWVDDLAQEVFLVAYRRFDRFEGRTGFGRWLRGIARNLVNNERRKTARRSRLLQESIVDLLADADAAGPAEPPPAARLVQVMAECVGRLPERSRELLQGRYADSTDAPTLALRFALSADAVRQTLVRSRAVVRRCIEAKLGEVWL